MRIIWVPLEPLPERYTEDWAVWFPREFKRLGIGYLTISEHSLTSSIEKGDVLDAFGTNYWKANQLAHIMNLWHADIIGKPGDVFLFADLWHPGIEMIRYAGAFADYTPPIAGVFHAGTYDPTDFTVRMGMRPWGKHFEDMLNKIVDVAFVATNYHATFVQSAMPDIKTYVTGLPFYADDVRSDIVYPHAKYNTVIFPHRQHPEKHPELFDELQKQFPEAEFRRTQLDPTLRDKAAYRTALAHAKVAVSFAEHEMFGYAMLEATALGCVPVVPNGRSYVEMYPDEYRYDTFDEAVDLVSRALNGDLLPPDDAVIPFAQYEHAIEMMTNICGTLTQNKT